MPSKRKRKIAWLGNMRITPITSRERKAINKRIKKKQDRLRRKYPEIRGKVVDFITHSIEDGTLYFTVRFKDKTDFSLRYASRMYITGADISDVTSGDSDVIREYIRPVLE